MPTMMRSAVSPSETKSIKNKMNDTIFTAPSLFLIGFVGISVGVICFVVTL